MVLQRYSNKKERTIIRSYLVKRYSEEDKAGVPGSLVYQK